MKRFTLLFMFVLSVILCPAQQTLSCFLFVAWMGGDENAWSELGRPLKYWTISLHKEKLSR
jgi:hypothetical protein